MKSLLLGVATAALLSSTALAGVGDERRYDSPTVQVAAVPAHEQVAVAGLGAGDDLTNGLAFGTPVAAVGLAKLFGDISLFTTVATGAGFATAFAIPVMYPNDPLTWVFRQICGDGIATGDTENCSR